MAEDSTTSGAPQQISLFWAPLYNEASARKLASVNITEYRGFSIVSKRHGPRPSHPDSS